MLTGTFSTFWQARPHVDVQTARPKSKPAPVFIGDAVQPWGGETLLLSLLRDEALRAQDDSA